MATVTALRRTVPPAVPGEAYLPCLGLPEVDELCLQPWSPIGLLSRATSKGFSPSPGCLAKAPSLFRPLFL